MSDKIYDEMLKGLFESLRAAAAINDGYQQVVGAPSAEAISRDLQGLEKRASSQLLSVAFCGAFSAGKSFLVSALVNRVEYRPVPDGSGRFKDLYTSKIPAFPRSSSSCPLAVEPLPATAIGATPTGDDSEDRFFVLFDDSETWEERSPAAPSRIKAYVTELPNVSFDRESRDRKRKVVRVSIHGWL